MKTQKTIAEIVDETANAYTAKTRSINLKTKWCAYNSPNGRHCAFARMCLNTRILSDYEFCSVSYILKEMGESILKEEYRGHPVEFYTEIQQLHDKKGNWDNKGLNDDGKIVANSIKERYS